MEKTSIDTKTRDALAREIKKAYTERKSALLGRKWKPSSRHQSFKLWQQAANQAIQLNAPAETYVFAAFTYCTMTTGPFPNMLGGQAAAYWWREYVRSNPGYREEAEYYKKIGLPEDCWHRGPAIREIMEDLKFARQVLYERTGEKDWPPIGPESLEVLRTYTVMFRPHVRLILGYPDETMRKFFGQEMLENFEKRPDVFRAMERLGFDMIEIMAWLRQE